MNLRASRINHLALAGHWFVHAVLHPLSEAELCTAWLSQERKTGRGASRPKASRRPTCSDRLGVHPVALAEFFSHFFVPQKEQEFAEFNLSFGRTDLKTGLGVAVWI